MTAGSGFVFIRCVALDASFGYCSACGLGVYDWRIYFILCTVLPIFACCIACVDQVCLLLSLFLLGGEVRSWCVCWSYVLCCCLLKYATSFVYRLNGSGSKVRSNSLGNGHSDIEQCGDGVSFSELFGRQLLAFSLLWSCMSREKFNAEAQRLY